MFTITRARRSRLLPCMLLLACCAANGARADLTALAAWQLEQGTNEPSYAVVEPASTNLNIDAVVLACEEAWHRRVLQLQLYTTDDGPLKPKHMQSRPLKDDPRAAISIDGQIFRVGLLFADDYAVLADSQDGLFPLLSDRLVAAMQTGKTMTLHFDLLAERPGQPPTFDGEAVVDLEAPGGAEAIAAMRRCTSSADELRVNTSLIRH